MLYLYVQMKCKYLIEIPAMEDERKCDYLFDDNISRKIDLLSCQLNATVHIVHAIIIIRICLYLELGARNAFELEGKRNGNGNFCNFSILWNFMLGPVNSCSCFERFVIRARIRLEFWGIIQSKGLLGNVLSHKCN